MMYTFILAASALSPSLRPLRTVNGGVRHGNVRLAIPGEDLGDAVRRSLDGEKDLADLLGKIQAEVS